MESQIPLVMISGLLSNKSLWQHQSQALSDLGPIHFFSPSEETPEKMIQGILDKAPPKFALIGHSMGGWLSLELMWAAPSSVTKLCLLNTTARMDSKEKRMHRLDLIQKAKQGFFLEVVESILEHFLYNQSVKNDVRKMFLEVGVEAFIRQQNSMIQRRDCQPLLSSIQCPTLVIHARQDKNFSLDEHQELVDHIPNARLAIIEDSGHMSPMERPLEVSALLRGWLTHFDGTHEA